MKTLTPTSLASFLITATLGAALCSNTYALNSEDLKPTTKPTAEKLNYKEPAKPGLNTNNTTSNNAKSINSKPQRFGKSRPTLKASDLKIKPNKPSGNTFEKEQLE